VVRGRRGGWLIARNELAVLGRFAGSYCFQQSFFRRIFCVFGSANGKLALKDEFWKYLKERDAIV